jgi:hypothetical protein
VKRTAETPAPTRSLFSAVRFTDLPFALAYPSSELLGYYQSSAKRGLAEIVLKNSPLFPKRNGHYEN